MVEQWFLKPLVRGSNPFTAAKSGRGTAWGGRFPCKEDVSRDHYPDGPPFLSRYVEEVDMVCDINKQFFILISGASIPLNVSFHPENFTNVEDLVDETKSDLLEYISSIQFQEELAQVAFTLREELKWHLK